MIIQQFLETVRAKHKTGNATEHSYRPALEAVLKFPLATLVIAAVVLVNCTPENPYRSVPIHLLPGRIGHFLSFSSMIRALSDLWPFLTLLFLLVSLPLRYAPNRR